MSKVRETYFKLLRGCCGLKNQLIQLKFDLNLGRMVVVNYSSERLLVQTTSEQRTAEKFVSVFENNRFQVYFFKSLKQF